MLFIGLAILVAAALGLIIASDAGALIGLDQSEFGQLVFLAMVLILVGSALFGRRVRAGEMLSGAVMWALIFAVALGAYTFRYEFQSVGARLLGELVPGTAEVLDGGGTVVVRRAFNGSFEVNGSVNGTDVRFVFDTGASAIVLSASDAERAGLDPGRLRYTVPVQTANGTGRAALVRLDNVSIGGISRGRIEAFVAEPGSLKQSLLGMTFLQTLESYSVSNDRLELRG